MNRQSLQEENKLALVGDSSVLLPASREHLPVIFWVFPYCKLG